MPAGSEILAERGGYVGAIDTEALGLAIIELGGGRKMMTDTIDHAAGLEMLVRLGDKVTAGQPLIRVFGPAEKVQRVRLQLVAAIALRDEPPALLPLIAERIA